MLYSTYCIIVAVIVLIAIMLLIDSIAIIVLFAIIVLIDIIAIIVLVSFCCQIQSDLGIPDNIWVDKRAAIARQLKIWEISSVLP